jgi:hypothetical protein
MCLAVYLATQAAIPVIEWKKEAPAFYLERVAKGQAVRKQFSLPLVYYVGTHEGCSCGFLKDGEVGDDLERCQENYRSFGLSIRSALAQGSMVQVFSCWEGDQGVRPKSIEWVTAHHIEAPDFEFEELHLLHVTDAS